MLIVLLDEPGLFVFDSPEAAVREIEAIDAECEIRAAFDESATPYRVEWLRPNRHSKFLGFIPTVDPGEYRLVPAGPAQPMALRSLLERHLETTTPPEAEPKLRELLATLEPSNKR